MKYRTKPLSVLFISALLIFSAQLSYAQYPGMGAFRAQQTMQLATQQMQMQMQMMNMRGVTGTVEEYDFEVTLRDSTKQEITSAIYTDSVTHKRFIVMQDKKFKRSDTNRYKKIYPSQTLSIDQQTVYYENGIRGKTSVRHSFGKPADSCWMFNVKPGAINSYSYSSKPWSGPNSPVMILGIQLKDGPIVQFSHENLQQMLQNDTEAMKYFDEKKYFKAIDKYNKDAEKADKK